MKESHSRPAYLQNEKGSILLYVMVLAAVLSIFFLSFGDVIRDLQRQASTSQMKSDRSFQGHQLVNLMKVPEGLIESAGIPGNEKLYTCLRGGMTDTCLENCCHHGQTQGFTYVDAMDNNVNVNLKRKLTGPPEKPVFYYKNGFPCVDAGLEMQSCDYSLSTTFVPTCPGGESACEFAEHLKVRIHMAFNPNSTNLPLHMRDRSFEFIYHNTRNYRPSILPIPALVLYLGNPPNPQEVEVSVVGDSGHPSEFQNFLFTICESTNSGIVSLVTPSDQPFASGVSKIRVKPVAEGKAKIRMQISDAALENNLSKVYELEVIVYPGAPP